MSRVIPRIEFVIGLFIDLTVPVKAQSYVLSMVYYIIPGNTSGMITQSEAGKVGGLPFSQAKEDKRDALSHVQAIILTVNSDARNVCH